jgi:protein-tyrosine-phosphatase
MTNSKPPRTMPIEQAAPDASSARATLVRNIRLAARKLLPESVVREVRNYQAYGRNERGIYLKTRILNGIRSDRRRLPGSGATVRSIVFVCFGNIIRSPMCEALMKRVLADYPQVNVAVASAGLNATEGRAAHPWAVAAAREFGIHLEHHRARLLTKEMVTQADAIFAMDYQNQVQLLSRWPESKNKVYLLSAYAGPGYRCAEIADPYYLDEDHTRICYQILDICVRNLTDILCRGHQIQR